MERDGGRRGAWHVLLGVDDDAALRRELVAVGRLERASGARVVVGSFGPSNGAGPSLDDLPVLQLVSSERGHPRVEIDRIKQLRPDVVLLDDLARYTAVDAEHVPAVTALRALGIDVVCTLRARDIRSLVARLAEGGGASARTVPDRALVDVDQVTVVPGNSPPADVALAREWARRPRVTHDHRDVAVTGAWSGRVVVAFDAHTSDDVVARAADLARATGAHLVGANVRTSGGPSDPSRLRHLHGLLEAEDADIVEVVDDDPGWALARVAEAEDAHVIVEQGTATGDLLLDHRTAGARGLDLHVVTPAATMRDAGAATPPMRGGRRQQLLPGTRRRAALAITIVGLPLLTVAMTALRTSLELSTVLLVYLALTVVTTAIGGVGPGLLSAVGGFALGDYYFTRPFHQWVIDDPDVIVSLVVFIVVAALVSVLVDIAARRDADARRAGVEASALSRLASAALDSRDPIPRLLFDLRSTFDLDGVAVLRRTHDGWRAEHAAGTQVPQRPADATDAIALGPGRYLALVGARTPAADSRVLMAFAAQLALASDRTAAGAP